MRVIYSLLFFFSSTGSNFELESQKERNSFEEEGELRVKRKLDPIIFSLPFSFSSLFFLLFLLS